MHAGAELLYRLLLVVALWGGEVHEGYAPRYSPGVMERVARNRDMQIADCMVSSPRYAIGTWVWVYGRNTDTLLHCRVTDVSADRDTTGRGRRESDRQRHIRTRREVELGYTEAVRLCGRAALQDRPERCPVVVVFYEQDARNGHHKLDRAADRPLDAADRRAPARQHDG